MLFGAGKAVITPPVGINLAGFGFRNKGSEFVRDELEARAFWLDGEDGTGGPVCMVMADLIGFDAELDGSLRAFLAREFALSPGRILLSASHTHSGPQTCSRLAVAGGVPDASYLSTLRMRIREAVGQARAGARPAVLHVSRGVLSGYAVNRRVRQGTGTIMAANQTGPRDDEVTVLSFHAPDAPETLRGLLFHYTCHPTTLADYGIGPDYPGAARRHLEKELSGAPCAFLQGCCGDVRPACVRIGRVRFRTGTPEDAVEFGEALGSEVLRALRGPRDAVEPRLDASLKEISLPISDGVSYAPFVLQRIDLAERLSLVAMSGEVCVGYGHYVKGLDPSRTLIPVGYSNGLTGYIPMAHMFAEGGYEPVDSAAIYGHPAVFSNEIERVVKEGIRKLMA